MEAEQEQGLSVRVLFAGACRGNFSKLAKRVEKVQNKNGPFDALFCVGTFFSEPGLEPAPDEEFIEFLNSGQRMPMKTYILGAYGRGSEMAKQRLEQVDCNIQCLGRSGIFEMSNGLTVAFLEGIYHPEKFEEDLSEGAFYTKHDVASLKKSVQSYGGDVDFFLSCEWPMGIVDNIPTGSSEEHGELPRGSQHIANLLTIVRPRYHVTSEPPLCYTRVPYINPDLGAGPHVTRFTSLCPFGAVVKQNLFALCLTPAQFMSQAKLCEIPPDATDCPFKSSEDGKRPFNPQGYMRMSCFKVGKDVAVDDSSCTPRIPEAGYAPSTQHSLPQMAWSPTNVAVGYQHSQSAFGLQPPAQSSPTGNGQLGSGVQTLLRNIGRGSVFSASLQSQESPGSDSFGFAHVPQALPVTHVPVVHPNLCVPSSVQPHQMNIAPSSQNPFGAAGQPSAGDLQTLWMSLARNPQLLSAAISMGLLQNPVNSSPIFQPSPEQPYLAGATVGVAQQQMHPAINSPIKMEVDSAVAPQNLLLQAQSPVSIDPERAQFPAPDSKRYKKEGDHRLPVVKDRRKTCFVGHIHPDATRQDLASFFSQAGEVVHVVLNVSEKSDLKWGFVQFATQQERNHAAEMLHNVSFGGHELVVQPAKHELEFDPNEPVKECWFCLGSPASDNALVVSVGSESYLAVDKGPISEDHVLVIPTNHFPNTLRMTEKCYAEMQSYLSGLRDLFASQGRYMLAFERYLQIPRLHGNHTHISVISIDEGAARVAKETFIQRGRMQAGEWECLSPEDGCRENVHDLVGDEEYLLVILPDGSKLARPMFRKSRLPVSFGRNVMAELAGIPERADWKACLSSQAEEKIRVEKFKAQFNSYDYPNQG